MLPGFLLVFYFLNYNNVTRNMSSFSLAQRHCGSPTLDLLFGVKIVPVSFPCWRSWACLLWAGSCGAHGLLHTSCHLREQERIQAWFCWCSVPLWKTCKALLDSLSLYKLTHEYLSWSCWETRQHNGNDQKNHLPSPHLNPRILMTSFPFNTISLRVKLGNRKSSHSRFF